MAKVRLADIAEKVGVSQVTVHNALSGNKGVSLELREKIQQVADELGYQSQARQKKQLQYQEEPKKIGVLIAENYLAEYTTYYWKIYQELALNATEKRCFTIVEVLTREMEKKNLAMPQFIMDKSIDGMIIIGEIDRKYIARVKESTEVPIVYLDFYDKDLAKDAVVTDNFYGMYLMTELVFAHGLEQIGFVGSIYATSSIMDRYCGFCKSMMEHRKAIQPEWILEDRDEKGKIVIELPKRLPQAFVCNCDYVAGILIHKLWERGIRVPEDISVVGFDNYLASGVSGYGYPFGDVKITTYEVNTKMMTKVALNKVLKRIKNPGYSPNLEVVSGHIVMKKTVKRRVV
ncbi:MAG: LacI family transcriptional regulator [Lachnospiraceae bacterium]|nr:LacI family transcriptional regulator [Lachnospiraceae bacterium]